MLRSSVVGTGKLWVGEVYRDVYRQALSHTRAESQGGVPANRRLGMLLAEIALERVWDMEGILVKDYWRMSSQTRPESETLSSVKSASASSAHSRYLPQSRHTDNYHTGNRSSLGQVCARMLVRLTQRRLRSRV